MTHATFRVLVMLVVLCAVLGGRPLHAQSNASAEERLLRSDPQELVEGEGDQRTVRTSLADHEEKDIRVAPASVQVITARQIRASGARDLLEILQTLPGLSFGRDADDVIGVGIHGNWAEEGKCLFLLNGVQLNENDYGAYAIGNRIPLDNVDRIEVIMGPGTVVYGGYAALGVINIITRNSQEIQGSRASFSTGMTKSGPTRTNIGVSGSQDLGKQKEIAYLLSMDRGSRSNATALWPDGRTIGFQDSTQGQTTAFNFSYRWKELTATMMYMDDAFEVSDGRYSMHLRDVVLNLEDRRWLSSAVGLSWKATHNEQIPWHYEDTTDPDRVAWNTENSRTSLSTVLTVRPSEPFTARFGAQAFHQTSRYHNRDESIVFALNDARSIAMLDVATFAELTLKGKPGAVSAACRYEYNSLSGRSVAPRFSYAKVFDRFHTKVLYSKAFKMPTVMNLNHALTDEAIRTEYATTAELEVGFRPGRVWELTANAYHTTLKDPIVYLSNGAGLDNYINRPFSGTLGIDGRFQLQTDRTTVQLGYGAYRTVAQSDIPETELPAEASDLYQGLPGQRVTLIAGWDVTPSFFLHGRAVRESCKWSYQRLSLDTDSLALIGSPDELLLSLGVTWRPQKLSKLEVDLGCTNILDQERRILSAYANGYPPFILNGREFTCKLIYRFGE